MSLPKKIEFTGGFTITPNGAGAGIGLYTLINNYRPANNNGEITLPDHSFGIPSLNFNDVDPANGVAIYINLYDSNGNDNTTYLSNLIGNHTHLTFTQGPYHITFDCTNQAWEIIGTYGPQIYHDTVQENAPANSMSIISTSGYTFNDVDPITISITII